MAEPSSGIAYLRLARSLPGWYRPIGEIFIAIVWWFVAVAILGGLILGAAHAKKLDELGPVARLANLHFIIALMTPAVLASAHVMGRRAGLLTSVRGRMRWRWLARCAGYAFIGQLPFLAIVVGASALSSHGLSELGHGGSELLEIVAITLLMVPFQAAGEEYFNRGMLQQAVGAYGGPAWLAIAFSTAAFVAMHGAPHSGTIVIAAMGATYAWLTLKTGGLEAALASHAMNNVVAFTLSAAAHGTKLLDPEKMNERVSIPSLVVQLGTLALTTALTVRGWRRSGLSAFANAEDIPRSAKRAFPAANQVEQNAPEGSLGVEHPDHGRDTEPLPPEQQ